MDYFLSLDVGTTSVKVALVAGDGEITAVSTTEYTLHTPAENIVELNPQVYWNCCRQGVAEVLKKSGVPPEQIKSAGVCSQGETLICLGKNDKPLRNAIVWMDNRSAAEAEELKSVFGTDNNTGQTDLVPTWPITKILWLKRNEPQTYAKVNRFLLPEDYILFRLTGLFRGEYSLYTSSYMLDIVNKKWWAEILDYVGVGAEKLVDLCESGQVIGEVLPDVCEELGLANATKVVTGAMDQTAAMIGAGNIASGIVTETTGAALAICGSIDAYPPKDKKRTMAVQYHAIPDEYFLIGWCPTGGMALKWLRDAFFADEKAKAAKENKDAYDYMTTEAAKIPPGCQGLVFLPYLAGPGTIDVQADAKGVFFGLELHHSRAHFARAVMEAIGFILRMHVEEMETLGLDCTEIRSLGGGSKSRLWNQIKADILGKPVTTMKSGEAAAIGTAILQAKAIGTYPNLQQACEEMIQVSTVIEPSEQGTGIYGPVFERFVQINNKCFGQRQE